MAFPPHCLGRVHLPQTHCSGEKVPFRVEGGHHLQGVASDPDTTLTFRSSVNGVNTCTLRRVRVQPVIGSVSYNMWR